MVLSEEIRSDGVALLMVLPTQSDSSQSCMYNVFSISSHAHSIYMVYISTAAADGAFSFFQALVQVSVDIFRSFAERFFRRHIPTQTEIYQMSRCLIVLARIMQFMVSRANICIDWQSI